MSVTESHPFAPPQPGAKPADLPHPELKVPDEFECIRHEAEVLRMMGSHAVATTETTIDIDTLTKTPDVDSDEEEVTWRNWREVPWYKRGMTNEFYKEHEAYELYKIREAGAGPIREQMARFTQLLPTAKIDVATRPNVNFRPEDNGNYGPEFWQKRSNEFRGSEEELRNIEANVWWLKPPTRGIHEMDTNYFAPYYIVGKKPIEFKDDQSDYLVEVLAVRADNDTQTFPTVLRAVTSARMLDRADEMSRKRVGEVLDEDGLDKRFTGGGLSSQQYKTFVNKRFKGNSLVDEPRRDSKRAEFWAEKEQELHERGIAVKILPEKALGADDIVDYNIPHYARELAIMLGREDAYLTTLGKLDKPADK